MPGYLNRVPKSPDERLDNRVLVGGGQVSPPQRELVGIEARGPRTAVRS